MENFNELFKKKLAEQQFEGKEKYWAQLEKKLNETAQEKVAMAWYKKWLLPFITFVTLGVAALLFNNNNRTIENADLAQQTNENSASNSSAQEVETPTELISETNSKTSDVNESNASTVNEHFLNNTTQMILKKQSSAATSTANNKTKPSTSNTNEQASQIENYKSQNTANRSTAFASVNKVISKEPVLSNTDVEESNTPNIVDIASPQPETTIKNDASTTNSKEEYTSTKTNSTYKGLDFSQVEMPLAYISPKSLIALIYPTAISNLVVNMIPVNPVKPKNKLSLSVYGGAQLSMKNLFTSNGNTADYITRRKNEEANSIKPNTGIDIEMKRGHWTLTSGFNFHQQGEKRNYNDEFKRSIPYDSLVININNNSAWLIDSTSFFTLQYNNIITSYDTTITYYDETTGLFYTAQLPLNLTQSSIVDTNFYYLIDSTYDSDIDTVKTNYALKKQIVVKDPNQANLKGRNTFTYLEIPVLIGYEWGLKRWRISVKGGIGIGILTRQQSFYLASDEAEITPVGTDVYTKIMYNGIVRAGLHYNFTSQFGIDIVPFSRLNINNITNKNATFQQKYSNVGLQVGLNYKL